MNKFEKIFEKSVDKCDKWVYYNIINNKQRKELKDMKNTIKITVNKKEYNEYIDMLLNRGCVQIGTRLFEDNQSYIKINIEK